MGYGGYGNGSGKWRFFQPEMKVWIGNLDEATTWKELQIWANAFVKTRWVAVFKGKGKGTGMLAFKTEEEVTKAIAKLNGKELNGKFVQADAWEKPVEQEQLTDASVHSMGAEDLKDGPSATAGHCDPVGDIDYLPGGSPQDPANCLVASGRAGVLLDGDARELISDERTDLQNVKNNRVERPRRGRSSSPPPSFNDSILDSNARPPRFSALAEGLSAKEAPRVPTTPTKQRPRPGRSSSPCCSSREPQNDETEASTNACDEEEDNLEEIDVDELSEGQKWELYKQYMRENNKVSDYVWSVLEVSTSQEHFRELVYKLREEVQPEA